MVTFLNEESIFMCLSVFHPALSGIIVSLLLGENFLDSNKSSTSLFWYSSCSKVKILWEKFNTSIAYNMLSFSSVAVILATIFTHILLIKRQRQLKKQLAASTMVVTYNKDGTSISKRAEVKFISKTLFKHERTVITPKASQVSFLMRLLGIPLESILFYSVGSSRLPPGAQIFLFTLFSQVLLLTNVVETICSPKLRNSFIDYFQTDRYAGYDVTGV